MTIPKIIHQIWVDGTERPPITVEWAEEIQKRHPDYKYMLHTVQPVENVAPRIVANVQRLKILYETGGIYLDCDMKPVHTLSSLFLPADKINCDILHGRPHHAFIAVAPKNETIAEILYEFWDLGSTDYWGVWNKYSDKLNPIKISTAFCHYFLTARNYR
jgi:mannosyltransferase OCH1-like enzyme